jgi:hypothetical protein
MQILHCFDSVINDFDAVGELGLLQCSERELDVIGAVIHDQDVNEFCHCPSSGAAGMVKLKTEPSPGFASTHILPPDG